jgi:hypothetical protein
MDRSTGKSGCAFVVVSTPQEAVRVVFDLVHRAASDKGLKLGIRDISAQVSSMEHLMAALFPYATSVEWSGSTPRVVDSVDDATGNKFRGFCGSEELGMMAKNTDSPTRVSHHAHPPRRTGSH